ncbi:MAG: hypothetical protein ACR2GD_05140, partial [Pyrinomonadaceae bacterium]
IQDFTIENVTDPEKPFVYTFKIVVPNYASRTGKRLFFQPNVFERGASSQFAASTRKFSFGNGGLIRFPVSSYPAVKELFDAFNKADTHQLTLRQDAPPAKN